MKDKPRFILVLHIIKKFIYLFLPIFLFVASMIAVAIFYKKCYDYDTKTYVINENSFTTSDLLAVLTFLYGIILTIDIHYYDQIEPKYGDNGPIEEQFFEGNRFKRTVGIFNIMLISLFNLILIAQAFVAFNKYQLFMNIEHLLIALLFTDVEYVILCLIRQIKKWLDKYNKDYVKKEE